MAIAEMIRPTRLRANLYEVKRPNQEEEALISQALLEQAHFDAISAASEYFDFISNGDRHKVSTLKKEDSSEGPPKPSAGDIWMEITVNTYLGNLASRMYDPSPFDIANSRVEIKRARQGRSGVITETLFTIGSNSELYEGFLRNGGGKTIPKNNDRFNPAVRKADALIRHHIADLRRRESAKPL